MAQASFSVELWDGFDAVNARLENGLQVCRDVVAFYKKKAALEETYAKSLIELCKTVPSAAGGLGGLFSRGPPALDKEGTTLKGALLSVQEETGKIAGKHLEFASKINTDVCAPLTAFITTKENEKKKLVADGQKYIKTYKDLQANAIKAKDAYLKLCKEFEAAKDEVLKLDSAASTDPKKKPQVDKASARVADLEKKLEASITAYQEAITKANENQATHLSTEMPSILSQFQELEECRFATLLSAVRCYFIFQGTISTFIDEKAKDMQEKIGAAEASVDIKDFIEKSKTNEKKPEPLVFEVHKGKYPETLPKDQRGSAAVKPSEAVQAKKEEPKDANIINSPKLSTSSSSLTSSVVKSDTASPAQTRAAEPPATSTSTTTATSTSSSSEAAAPSTPVQEKQQPPRPANRDLFKGLFGDDAESDIFSDNKPAKPLGSKKNEFDDLLGSINENDNKLFGN